MHKHYRDAGYHKQAWKTPKADASIVGIYDTPDGELVVEHLPTGPSGLPEFKLSRFRRVEGDEHVFGGAVTVVCEDVARAYLAQFGATGKSRRTEPRGVVPKIELDHWREQA